MNKITKNQHYVPRFLLKSFIEESDNLYAYDSTRDIKRRVTAVENIFSENYFYDTDNTIENYISTYIEAPAAPIIKKILNDPENVTSYKSEHILKFVTAQVGRTPRALVNTLDHIDTISRSWIDELAAINGVSAEDASHVSLKVDRQSILGLQTIRSPFASPLISDLTWHVFINKTEYKFIISDDPVILYNWYLRNSTHKQLTSLTACGLQIILPISPSITLFLYDKDTYNLILSRGDYTLITDKNDVDLLNDLQVMNRKDCIVFSNENLSKHMIGSCKKNTPNSLHKSQHKNFISKVTSENEHIHLQWIWNIQKKLKKWLSFVKVKRALTKKKVKFKHRSLELLEQQKRFDSAFNQKIREGKGAN